MEKSLFFISSPSWLALVPMPSSNTDSPARKTVPFQRHDCFCCWTLAKLTWHLLKMSQRGDVADEREHSCLSAIGRKKRACRR
jgi:hypothetical protein